jgi:hypothetical protein
MNFEDFEGSLKHDIAPANITKELEAMWYAGKNLWDQSHDIAQDIHTTNGSWIHAYLHREEGDTGNAGYWYRKAGKTFPAYSLTQEWEVIVKALL